MSRHAMTPLLRPGEAPLYKAAPQRPPVKSVLSIRLRGEATLTALLPIFLFNHTTVTNKILFFYSSSCVCAPSLRPHLSTSSRKSQSLEKHQASRSGSRRHSPKGPQHTICEACGSTYHTLHGFWKQRPQILGTWTLWLV